MKMYQILAAIKSLSHSQGYYGRLFQNLMDIKSNDPDKYDEIASSLEDQKFGGILDMVLYFET